MTTPIIFRRSTAIVFTVYACIAPATAAITVRPDFKSGNSPTVVGSWTEPAPLGTHAIHAIYLVTGKLLIWNRMADTYLFDPKTGISVKSSQPPHNIFCAGHVVLPDGRVFIAGGHVDNYYGMAEAAIYNPYTDSWTSMPEMASKRWYPTCELRGNGKEVFVLGGQITPQVGMARFPEIYNVDSNTWRELPVARTDALYPMLYLDSTGSILDVGPLSKTKKYRGVDSKPLIGSVATNLSEIFRGQSSSAMYLPGKVLFVGGGDPPLARADIIDFNVKTPAWTTIDPMSVARRQCNVTILPTGEVLATGGSQGAGFSDATSPSYEADLWNPETLKWSSMAPATSTGNALAGRFYHSNALLLSDGKVFSSAGEADNDPSLHFPNYNLFSPPYLFKGARPLITSAPEHAFYSRSINISTPIPSSIQKVVLLKRAAVTHGVNMDQRYVPLRFSVKKTKISAVMETNPNVLTPGYYDLFLVNYNGVPSEGHLIHVDKTPIPPSDHSVSVLDAETLKVSWIDHTMGAGITSIEVSSDGINYFPTSATFFRDYATIRPEGAKFVRLRVSQFGASSLTEPIRISWSPTTLTLKNAKCPHGEIATFFARLTDGDGFPVSNALVKFYVDGAYCGQAVSAADGRVQVSRRMVEDGPDRPIQAVFAGDQFVGGSSAVATFHESIPQLVTKMWLGTRNGFAGAEVTVPALLLTKIDGKGVPNKLLHFSLDGLPVGDATTDKDGIANVTFVPNVGGASIRNLTVSFDGDEGAKANVATTPFGIRPATTAVWISATKIYEGESLSVRSSLINTITKQPIVGKQINYYVNGTRVGTASTDEQGVAYATINDPGAGPGAYPILVAFDGDEKLAGSRMVSTLSVQAQAKLLLSDISARIGDTTTIKGTLTDRFTGLPLAGGEVTFKVRDIVIGSAVSDSEGKLSFDANVVNLPPGKYTMQASMSNDSMYGVSNATASYRIVALDALLTVNDAVGKAGESTHLVASLANLETGEKLSGRTITFKVRDFVLGSAVTNENGEADISVAVPDLPAGRFSVVAIFETDGTYGSTLATNTFRVTKQ